MMTDLQERCNDILERSRQEKERIPRQSPPLDSLLSKIFAYLSVRSTYGPLATALADPLWFHGTKSARVTLLHAKQAQDEAAIEIAEELLGLSEHQRLRVQQIVDLAHG
jgi:hypothetical protein